MKIHQFLRLAADVLIPRFLTEDVALEFMGGDRKNIDSYRIICAMSDIQPGEEYDAVAAVDSFGWLGLGVTYRVGECRPWPSS